MATYYYLVLGKATPGNEEAFQDWYDDQHLADCVAVPGVKSAKRFRILNGVGLGTVIQEPDFNSFAIYEMETDDPVAVARELRLRAGTEVMPLSPACDRDASVKYIALAAGECGRDDQS